MSKAFLACPQSGCRGSPASWGLPLTPAKLTPLWTALVQLSNLNQAGGAPPRLTLPPQPSTENSEGAKNFGFLKDPLIVNDVFLKKPSRIEALGLVLVLALLLSRLMERAMRSKITEDGSTLQGINYPAASSGVWLQHLRLQHRYGEARTLKLRPKGRGIYPKGIK